MPSGLTSINYQIVWKEGGLQISSDTIKVISSVDSVFCFFTSTPALVLVPYQFTIRPLVNNSILDTRESIYSSPKKTFNTDGTGAYLRYEMDDSTLINDSM